MGKITAPTGTGKRVNELIIKNRLSADDAVRQVLGPIDRAQIPPGSQIINEGLNGITFIDPQGYTHNLRRNGDANSPQFGSVEDVTDRPGVLPLSADPQMANLMKQLTERAAAPTPNTLPKLDESVMAELDAITKATDEQLNQFFERSQGSLVADLFGRGLDKSSLAADAAAKMTQEQGLVKTQAASDAASRSLGLKQALLQIMMEGRGQDINTLLGLTGNETQRATTSAGIAESAAGRKETGRQFDLNYLLEQEKINASKRSSLLQALTGIASAGLSFIPGVGPALSAATSIFGKATGGAAGRPPVGGDGGYG